MVTEAAQTNDRIRRAEGLRLTGEVFAACDWLRLRVSPVYYGYGVDHGDGEPVVLVPGFLGSDLYLRGMHRWLRRLGYSSYASAIGRNYDCPDLLAERLLLTIDQASLDTGRKVHLIGHSLGGTLARVVVGRAPTKVAQVITLGSPLESADVHPLVLAAQEVVRRRIHSGVPRQPECYTDSCTCPFVSDIAQGPPPSIPRHAIYTRTDGVVGWNSCVEDDPAMNIEVRSSHLGLAFNAEAYREIARLLKAAA